MPGALLSAESLYIGMEVVIAVASVIGNVMVVWAVKINKSLRDNTFCFIVSLALADIAVGALVIPLAITISIGLQTHFYSCLLVACTVLVLTQSSILALLAIAIDRYLRVKIPTRYKRVVTPRRAGLAVVICWTVAFIVGLTPMLGWNNLKGLQQNGSISSDLIITCQFENVISMDYMVYFNFFGWVLPPLLFMLVIYAEIFYVIHKQLNNKKFTTSHADPNKYYNKELNLAKSLALVLFLFAISWLPLHIINCITLFCPDCQKPIVLLYVAILLTHGNSAVNPIIYAFRIKKFRTAFRKIWQQYFCCKDTPALEIQPSDRKEMPDPESELASSPQPPQKESFKSDPPQQQPPSPKQQQDQRTKPSQQPKEHLPLLEQNSDEAEEGADR
ncbi:LOW QUALITY PROTEIN: adenosine receptor A1b [Pseudoliparis swirei]|uniref:LOW QUALITY PROTEIN: adenosine receptor A1b n=1 Tax=Pseudoliparis swirei TaxID=2059687 RepID=UPI0024BDBD57|nr:LOW QUALITY PROTEIN: adenosine receptor A1b [Pseudoliparis swirei]